MAKILLIETSTALCSAAISINGESVASRRSDNYILPDGTRPEHGRAHASLTAVFCDELLRETGLKASELDAVCISGGPGSYTGLRVGLSTAKGICFGAGIRLLSVCSLDILAEMGKSRIKTSAAENTGHIIPMIDARRMEVYTAIYDLDGTRQCPVSSKVFGNDASGNGTDDTDLYDTAEYAALAPESLFIGDGALKCKAVLPEGGLYVEAYPDAEAMAPLAEKEYAAQQWRDVAYFEPFYLKDFVATTSRKKLF